MHAWFNRISENNLYRTELCLINNFGVSMKTCTKNLLYYKICIVHIMTCLDSKI